MKTRQASHGPPSQWCWCADRPAELLGRPCCLFSNISPILSPVSLVARDGRVGRTQTSQQGWDNGSIDTTVTQSTSPPPAQHQFAGGGEKSCWLLTETLACSQQVESEPCIDYPAGEELRFCKVGTQGAGLVCPFSFPKLKRCFSSRLTNRRREGGYSVMWCVMHY